MTAVPTVYFIDDSATMREVIKIAFRRENINVVACHDATQALSEIEKSRPDIVITDVIMPDKDGYDVCQYIKSHPQLAKTPVVLMSGVVNRAVAEKAFAVRADELLRKPFQPQDLIARVKHLLKPNGAPAPAPAPAGNAAAALTSIFSSAPMPPRSATAMGGAALAAAAGATAATIITPAPQPAPASTPSSASTAPSAAPFPVSAVPAAPTSAPASVAATAVAAPAIPPAPVATSTAPAQVPAAKTGNGNEVSRLKIEIMRLEGLVKKLQSELKAEREYAQSLEAHMKTLQESGR